MVQLQALLWSRDLTHGVLCVIEFLCRCWVVITWYHITVGWRASQGERERWVGSVQIFECVCTALRLSQRGQWRNDKSVHNYYIFTLMEINWAKQGCLGIYLSVIVVTALQWSLGKDRVITVWSFPAGMIMWKEFKDYCSKNSLNLLQPPRGTTLHLQKMLYVYAIESVHVFAKPATPLLCEQLFDA